MGGGVVGCRSGLKEAEIGRIHIPELRGERSRIDTTRCNEGGAVPGPKPDPTGAKILDGAIRVLGDFGVKRATVELVANYAGVSHMTIYRRWPSKNDLLKTAIVGEFTTLLDTAFENAAEHGTSFADRTLTAFSDTVWAVQTHPLALRELNTDSSEQLPMLSSTSSAVMEAGVPLVAEQLHRLAETADGTPADLDSVADVFVRLGYSLVVVTRPGHLLTTRAEVAAYAGECFGPYLNGLSVPADQRAEDAVVVSLDQHRVARDRKNRPYLQIAAASIFSVLTLGAGLTAVLGGSIKLPFVTPAGISKPTTTPIPGSGTSGPGQSGAGTNSELQLPGSPAQQSDPGSVAFPPVTGPAAIPNTIPVIELGPRSAATIGSIGGQYAGDNQSTLDSPRVDTAVPAVAPPRPSPNPGPGPGPTPGPRPLDPAPNPGPGPGPGPQPGPGPGPQPAPKPPGPGPAPAPKPAGPGPQQQNQQQQNQQPGQQQPGSGPRPKQGPSN